MTAADDAADRLDQARRTGQMGVDQPDFGSLLPGMVRGDGEEIAWHDVMQPRLEGEVALVLEPDLVAESPTAAFAQQ